MQTQDYSQCLPSSASAPASTTAAPTSTPTTLTTNTTGGGVSTTAPGSPSTTGGTSTGGANSINEKFRAKGKLYFGVATDQNRLSVVRMFSLVHIRG